MAALESLQVQNNLCTYRLRGKFSLVETVDQISQAIAHCRERGVSMLLVDATGIIDLPVPTLVDRFLMIEDWAQEAKGVVVVAMIVEPQYMHPRKFGVSVALKFGLICDVHNSEADASEWLMATAAAQNGT